jgi:hypothetical protein
VKNLVLLSVGVALGLVGAHLLNSTPRGRRFFGELDGGLDHFRAAVVDGYRSRDAELRATDPSDDGGPTTGPAGTTSAS